MIKNFYITFRAENGSLISKLNEKGIGLIEKFAKEFNLHPCGFDYLYLDSLMRKNKEFYIDDINTINKIKHFKAKNNIDVVVPQHYFDKYIIYKVSKIDWKFFEWKKFLFFKLPIFGKEYNIIGDFNKNKIINDWIDDGCPLDWNIDDKKLKRYHLKLMNGNEIISDDYSFTEFLINNKLTYYDYAIYDKIINLTIEEIEK